MTKQSLDFFVIGTQKAGTTTLFELLAQHPQLYLPQGKEAHFFSIEKRYSKGWEKYLRTVFGQAPADKLWGTVTPSYMSHPESAKRIAKHCPRAKIIAILRDPVERALSQYKMNVRRGAEKRSFDAAIREQMQDEELARQRERHTQTQSYVVRGEYGRILERYYHFFPCEQIFVCLLDELRADPVSLLAKIHAFLGVETFMADDSGRTYHASDQRTGFPKLAKLYYRFPLSGMLLRAVPMRRKAHLLYELTISHDGKPIPAARLRLETETERALRAHYAKDAALCEKLTGIRLPWPESQPD